MPSLAAAEPTTTRFAARVEHRDGDEVVLSESYFYPEGGGQPADHGTVAGVPVVHVESRDGTVVHHLDGDAEASAGGATIEVGAEVTCTVDEQFRTYCMRAHTASHVLYGAGRRLFEDLGYGGFGISSEKVRVDFSTPSDIDDDALVELERLVNRTVWESRPVSWEEVPKGDALSRPDIAFNTKTEEGLGTDSVRVVTVGPSTGESERTDEQDGSGDESAEDWDVAACGGTHVSNTRELGPVAVLDRSNPGEGLTRVEFAVGPSAIDRRATEKRALLAAARDLGTGLAEVPDGIERLRRDRNDAAAERDALREEVVGARLRTLRNQTVERDGATWLVGTVDGLDANALADHAREFAGDGADVVALVADSSLAVATTDGHDANAVVSEVTDQFGGGGGGSPTVAQGGGLSADPEAVVAFLRGE